MFDPKLEAYVVTISHSKDYQVGQILDSPEKSNRNPNVKVVLCGLANKNNPELAKQLKLEYQAKFTPEFADNRARDIQRIPNSLLLFDVGGKMSAENQMIMCEAVHAVILAKTETDVIA